MIARFKQEIQLSRKIGHPNVCRVYDLAWHQVKSQDPPPPVFFLTMEFLSGETLSARLGREGPMSTQQALVLVQQMADALEAAHRAGIVHRDFKPSNVMLVSGPEGLRALVTDFGLARRFSKGSESTETMTRLVGTLDYMAPELLTGSIASTRSDLYALAMVVYKMVTGSLPFRAETPFAAALLRARQPVPSPRLLVPELAANWEHSILRALDADPRQRFATAGDFVKALRGELGLGTTRLTIFGRRKVLVPSACAVLVSTAVWIGWQRWSRDDRPPPEAVRLYRLGVDDIQALAYFASTKALEQAVKLAPHYRLAHARLAEAWVELELPEKAGVEMLIARRDGMTGLSSLDRMQIDAIDLMITRDFARAAENYKEMLKGVGREKADLYVDLGRIYEKSEQRANALANYTLATETDPRNAAAWLHLAAIHSQALQSTQAQEEFTRAEQLYSVTSNLEGLTEVAYQRSADASRRERLEENIDYAHKMLETATITGNIHQQIRAKLQLGSSAYFAGDSALAQLYAREALDTARSNHIGSLAIRGILMLSNGFRRNRDYTDAERYCREALAEARQTQSSWLTAVSLLALAGLHDEQGRSEAAVDETKEALAFFEPQHYMRESLLCLALLGRWQRNHGEPAALDTLQRALQIAQKLQDSRQITLAHASIGSLLVSQEQLPEALIHFEESLQYSTTTEQTGYAALECAEVLWQLGRYQEATVMFNKADENAAKFLTLRLHIAVSRAEMFLSQRKFNKAAVLCTRTLAALPAQGELVTLNRVLGLALIGAGRKDEGHHRCEAALVMAESSKDLAMLHAAQLAAAEARFDVGDVAASLALIQNIEQSLVKLPLSHLFALTLAASAGSDNKSRYAAEIKQQLDEIAQHWGTSAFQLYIARPDLAARLRGLPRP
jgi:tetratricopeptide (TPR) repeat protein